MMMHQIRQDALLEDMFPVLPIWHPNTEAEGAIPK